MFFCYTCIISVMSYWVERCCGHLLYFQHNFRTCACENVKIMNELRDSDLCYLRTIYCSSILRQSRLLWYHPHLLLTSLSSRGTCDVRPGGAIYLQYSRSRRVATLPLLSRGGGIASLISWVPACLPASKPVFCLWHSNRFMN